MEYLSEFEVLSEAIVPPPLDPAADIPFVIQGYFVLISRLQDAIAGELPLTLTFTPTLAFPLAANLLVDLEDDTGNNRVLALDATNSVSFNVGSGKTVLLGIQCNFTNTGAGGPLDPGGGTFGVRGYVMISPGSLANSPGGTFQLAVTPEIRATFLTVAKVTNGNVVTFTPNFMNASSTAYTLPTANGPLISVTKGKETKEKEASKDNKDTKDRKDAKERAKDKDQIDKPQAVGAGQTGQVETSNSIADLTRRLAALEEMMATGEAFITADQRPKVG